VLKLKKKNLVKGGNMKGCGMKNEGHHEQWGWKNGGSVKKKYNWTYVLCRGAHKPGAKKRIGQAVAI